MILILLIILTVIVIFYYRAKNKYLEKHPEKIKKYKCSFCGREFQKVTKLSDGAICEECEMVGYSDGKISVFEQDHSWESKKKTCDEIRCAISDLKTKGQILPYLSATRTSESGKILVDDNQKVFYIKKGGKPIILHYINEIKNFYLEYDYEEGIDSDSPDYVRSGHIVIEFNTVFDIEEITAHVDSKLIGQRQEVKRVFEGDLKFLEELTGKKRGSIPNKVKLI